MTKKSKDIEAMAPTGDADGINQFMADHSGEQATPHDTDVQRAVEAELKAQDKVTIIIHNQDGASGEQPVFVGVNGVGYHIPREKQVEVPKAVVEALENATETRYYRQEQDGQAFGPILQKEIRRFPFTVYR